MFAHYQVSNRIKLARKEKVVLRYTIVRSVFFILTFSTRRLLCITVTTRGAYSLFLGVYELLRRALITFSKKELGHAG